MDSAQRAEVPAPKPSSAEQRTDWLRLNPQSMTASQGLVRRVGAVSGRAKDSRRPSSYLKDLPALFGGIPNSPSSETSFKGCERGG
jgi:hypothetical protein